MSHIIRMAAMNALSPVRGAVGSKWEAPDLEEDVDDEDPELPVAVGF